MHCIQKEKEKHCDGIQWDILNPNMSTQMTVRLSPGQPEKLAVIAKKNYNTPSALVRCAIDELIRVAEANGGALMPQISLTQGAPSHHQAA